MNKWHGAGRTHGLHQEGEGVLGDVSGHVRVVRDHQGEPQQLGVQDAREHKEPRRRAEATWFNTRR